ncbi:MAG: hypothetical protein KZQ70_15740, partial [gamma proteobacterium symbiont of Lucinoma myriamae]|nr:hypothetical protein [gamma proteobacterium symbiont of Lucinoma myriamae]
MKKILNAFKNMSRTRLLDKNKTKRGITLSKLKIELWFLYSENRLVILNKCTEFHEKMLNDFTVMSQARITTKQKRGIT